MAGNKNSGRKAVKIEDDYERVGELVSPEFKRYAARIKRILERATEPLTIGSIYKLLDTGIRKDWTLDALKHIEVHESWILPRRYSLRTTKLKNLTPSEWGVRVDLR